VTVVRDGYQAEEVVVHNSKRVDVVLRRQPAAPKPVDLGAGDVLDPFR
jgi:hypothetical protein